MGWDFCREWKTKKDVIKYLTREINEDDLYIRKTLAYAIGKDGLWIVYEVSHSGNKSEYISLCLIKKDNSEGYGYKEIFECLGPCYYDCPLEFFKMVLPDPGDTWQEQFREKAIEYWKNNPMENLKIHYVEQTKTLSLF